MATQDSAWTKVSSTPPYSVFTKDIVKSEEDKRQYRVIQLENCLQATLVHDPETDKAAASLDVSVGHLFDPDDMPGLAHFCEHLLFMGTEQFPKENEYSEYLAKHNGASNAYTSTTNTNYYFSVSTPALRGALERFSGFFHSPLFAPSCTSRELNAVDSEHKKNHQTDTWRIFQLNKHLSKPGHVWSKFGSGNRASLSRAAREKAKSSKETVVNGNAGPSPIPSRLASPAPSVASTNSESEADGGSVGREIRRRLVEWWEKEYCAQRMRLCVVGQESLDELSAMVANFFSPIPNRGRDPLPSIPDHPFGEAEKGTLVKVQTVMSFHALEISFPMEYQAPYWRHKPTHFLSHFVGHEGPGSLHSFLKEKGWVTELSSGPQDLGRGFAMFKVTIPLTKDGFNNYEKVILATYQYLALLRASKFEEFHQQEIATISKTRFRFLEKMRAERYATWISEHMGRFPPEHLLDGQRVTWRWDEFSEQGGGEQKVREYLEKNLRVGEGRAVLMAREDEHVRIDPSIEWSEEPWYGTKYHVKKFDENFIRAAESPCQIPQLFLPGPNEFIPKNLDVDVKKVKEPAKRPHLIRQTNLSTLWHKKDDRFWAPKAHIVIDLRSPAGNASPRTSVMTRLYSDLVNDSLTEYTYDADLAGLSYQFVQHTTGLYVHMSGYNDKMAVLVQHVLEKIKGLQVNDERLAVNKEHAKRDWENFFLGQSYILSDYFGRYLLAEQQWTLEEKLKELPTITKEEIQSHMQNLLSQVNMRILVVGNMYKDEAIKIAEIAEEGLSEAQLDPNTLNDKCLILPKGSNYIWSLPVPNPQQANSALTYYIHFGASTDPRLRVVSSLLTQILSEPAFNVLRTKEQLGYIVFCSSWSLPGASQKGLRIVVQSEKGPVFLEQRVEAFLDTMKSKIEEMSLEEFETQKGGLEKKWLEADKNLQDEAGKYMIQINSGQLDFYRNENDAKLLKSVTKEEVQEFFNTYVDTSSPSRAKLSIHMKSTKPRPQKVSNSAALAFEALLHEAKLGVPEGWKESLGDAPSLQDFVTYWAGVLKDTEGLKVMQAIPEILKAHPVDGEQESEREDAVYIEDPKEFKSGLEVSVDPGALVQWGDLPVSKF